MIFNFVEQAFIIYFQIISFSQIVNISEIRANQLINAFNILIRKLHHNRIKSEKFAYYKVIYIICFHSSINRNNDVNRIKIQQNKIEDCIMKPQLTNSTIKTNKSTPLLTSNARIMKLIQNKKYPLRNGQKSELIFPKIKQRYKEVDPYIPPKVKKYVQINLKEEETNLFVPVPQEQLWQKYGIRSKAIQQQQINSKNHLNSYLQIIKKGPKKMNERQQQIIKKQNSTFNEYSCFPLVEGEQVLHAREYKNIITQQSQKNNSFLERIRESINSKKINYLKNVKPSEVLEGGNEKENYSFEYLVNKIESRNIKDSNLLKESAFQSLSPNRLKDYIDIFRCSKQNEKDLQNKQKECKQENLQTSEKIKNQNNAVLDKYSSFITSSLPSVQERLKVRYNKMIEVQKGK